MNDNLLPGLTCTTKLVLVKSHILQVGDHSSLVRFLEIAHPNVSDFSMPKSPK
jgi:hypothetical protein